MMVKDQSFYYYLFACPKFLSLCADRYTQLRNTVLSDEYLLDYIDSTCAYLGSAALRNCDKWYGSDYDLYYKEIEKMKDFVTDRGQWMDSHFADQIQLVISKG